MYLDIITYCPDGSLVDNRSGYDDATLHKDERIAHQEEQALTEVQFQHQARQYMCTIHPEVVYSFPF